MTIDGTCVANNGNVISGVVNTGVIVGTAISGLVGVVCILTSAWLLWKRSHNTRVVVENYD
jgi:hypothetical protein